MAELLDQLRIWIEQAIRTLGYPGISLVMLLENLFPPIPSEIVMPLAGFLVSSGQMNFWSALLFGTAGSVLGAVLIYWIGRTVGEEAVRTWFRRYGKYMLLQERDLGKALDVFERHGAVYILFSRLIPGIRSLISLPAGLEKMNIGIFLLYTLIGTAAWNAVLLLAGIFLGRQWPQVLEWVRTYELLIWIALGIMIVIFLARRLEWVEKLKRS